MRCVGGLPFATDRRASRAAFRWEREASIHPRTAQDGFPLQVMSDNCCYCKSLCHSFAGFSGDLGPFSEGQVHTQDELAVVPEIRPHLRRELTDQASRGG